MDVGQVGRRLHHPLQFRAPQATRVNAHAVVPEEQAEVRSDRQGVQAHHEAEVD